MKRVLVCMIRGYQIVLRPILPPACRYTPSCSEYFIQALQKKGLWKGFLLGVRRILRCHPWGGSGYDPVPD
ncbi:MAG: membrane protein insertion efficiency factor YidD [Planctomycetes bacterium]|nr:membrane protein insertion efficiency factor YidD [Planctomycetota bacterium]